MFDKQFYKKKYQLLFLLLKNLISTFVKIKIFINLINKKKNEKNPSQQLRLL